MGDSRSSSSQYEREDILLRPLPYDTIYEALQLASHDVTPSTPQDDRDANAPEVVIPSLPEV